MADQLTPEMLTPEMLMHIPVTPPPPGVNSNFIDPPSRAKQTQIAIGIMLTLMIPPLIMRIYTRARKLKFFGADDWFAIASAICVISYCGLLLWMLEYPLGRHEWDVPVGRLTTGYVKANMASLIVYALTATCVKVTLLLLYLRIFRPSHQANIMIWLGIAFVALFYLACAVAYIILFVPRPGGNSAWGVMSHRTTMIIMNTAAAQGVFGCVQDLYILMIPIHLVSGLRLARRKKIGVIALFLTGALASVCSIINASLRFVERSKKVPDSLWESIPVYTLSIIELNVGIICSCIPVIVVLFKDFAHSSYITSFRRYLRSRYASGHSDSESEVDEKAVQGLPEVPRGTLSGLKTFVRKFDRSQSRSQWDKTIPKSDFNTLGSTDESYHEVLKASK
ncbi:hypothetical protein DE146DRAFT_666327 [Phaeosphaeria sp. MPI-PUGE-AT-0046c]|nr:hypothetical protein DE146DRAFT_666327 [Phaeosphaeria sp. MPI-PUGE-AT-0046c]